MLLSIVAKPEKQVNLFNTKLTWNGRMFSDEFVNQISVFKTIPELKGLLHGNKHQGTEGKVHEEEEKVC